MKSLAARFPSSTSWMRQMCLTHCGKDYGSEFANAYFFYRVVYHMQALEAYREAKKWCGLM